MPFFQVEQDIHVAELMLDEALRKVGPTKSMCHSYHCMRPLLACDMQETATLMKCPSIVRILALWIDHASSPGCATRSKTKRRRQMKT